MATMMTVKGQVTVPKPIRDELGLKPGRPVLFVHNAAGEVVVKAGEIDAAERDAAARRIAAFDSALARTRLQPLPYDAAIQEFVAGLREPLPL